MQLEHMIIGNNLDDHNLGQTKVLAENGEDKTIILTRDLSEESCSC